MRVFAIEECVSECARTYALFSYNGNLVTGTIMSYACSATSLLLESRIRDKSAVQTRCFGGGVERDAAAPREEHGHIRRGGRRFSPRIFVRVDDIRSAAHATATGSKSCIGRVGVIYCGKPRDPLRYTYSQVVVSNCTIAGTARWC